MVTKSPLRAKRAWKICWIINNSAKHCPILLKFGMWLHYWPWLKPRTAGGTGDLKWQCIANCTFSSFDTSGYVYLAGGQLWRTGRELLARKAVWIRTWLRAAAPDQSASYLRLAKWLVAQCLVGIHTDIEQWTCSGARDAQSNFQLWSFMNFVIFKVSKPFFKFSVKLTTCIISEL